MRVDVRHHEIDPSASLSASRSIHLPARPRVPISYEYVPTVTQVFESLVDLLLYERRRSACARAEIDECVVGDGGAEDSLERAGDEGGGGCRLEDWSFVFPEKGEACLDEGAKGSGKPRIGSVVLAFCWRGWRVWRFGTRIGRRFQKDEAGEWARVVPWQWNPRSSEVDCKLGPKVIRKARVLLRQPRSAVALATAFS